MRKIGRSGSTFIVSAHATSAPLRRSRSLLQGDPASPAIFNATLDLPVAEFSKPALSKGWGYRVDDGSHVSLLLFADNFWLAATSPQELASMTEAWLARLSEYGWSVPLQETTWCSTGPDSNQRDCYQRVACLDSFWGLPSEGHFSYATPNDLTDSPKT